MNELRDKARRAFYAIKRQCPIEIPIRIWLKILESVIEPLHYMAVRCGVHWQTQVKISLNGKNTRLRPCMQNSVKIYYTCTGTQTNNACRAELGKYPLIIKIQKRAIQFWKHLKLSDPQSYHYKALQYQEMSKESKPFLHLIQSFSPDASLTLMLWLTTSEPIRSLHKSNRVTSLIGKPKLNNRVKCNAICP